MTIAAVRDDVPTLKALLASGASAKLISSIYDGTALIAAAHLGLHTCPLRCAGRSPAVFRTLPSTHPWQRSRSTNGRISAGLKEMRGVTRGAILLLSCKPDKIQCFWLNDCVSQGLATR